MTKLTYSLVIGDSFFWDPHWILWGCEGYICAQRKIKEPNAQRLDPLGPGHMLLNPRVSMVCRQGREWHCSCLKRACVLIPLFFLYVQFPSCSPHWGWRGEHYLCQEMLWQERKRKARQQEKEEPGHKVWSGIAAGFQTFLCQAPEHSCLSIPIIRLAMSGVYP